MSPSAMAPSTASVMACSSTSASEWPIRAWRVRDFHAAEPDMVALAERMDVKSHAGANVGQIVQELGFGAHKILQCGEFAVFRLSREDENAMARPFGDGGVVGQFAGALRASRRDGPCGSGRNETPAASARRASVARSGVADDAGVPGDLLDRVGDGEAGNGRAPFRAASFARSIRAALTKGRAASWIRTRSSAPQTRASVSRPLQTLSWRVAPPMVGGSNRSRKS